MNDFTRRVLLVWVGIGIAALAIVLLSIAAVHAENKPMLGGSAPRMGAAVNARHGRMMVPGIFGTVTAVNGATITILSGRPSSTATYSIDATNATVIKNATTSTTLNIAVGDVILAQGTASGTSVAATRIIDGAGMMGMSRGKFMGFPGGRHGDATSTDIEERENATSSDAGEFEGHDIRPSGTPPFASGTFPEFNSFSSSTSSGTRELHDGRSHSGFLGSVGNFFGNVFGHFKF
jgi:hypothetical protein